MKTARRLLALLFAAAAAGAALTARASTFAVTNSTSGTKTTFKITRSGDTSVAETVSFRTTSLTALAGMHFAAMNDTFTFAPGRTNLEVQVSEVPVGNIDYIYRYQTGTSRSYRFEVVDDGGFTVVSVDREIPYGDAYKLPTDRIVKNGTNIDLVYFNNSSYASGISSSMYVDVDYTPPTDDVESKGTLEGYVLIDGASDAVLEKYETWALTYGYDISGESEAEFLLDVAPASNAPEAALLKIVDFGRTNIVYVGEEFMPGPLSIPCLRIEIASDAAELKPGADYNADFNPFPICNGYIVISFAPDLSLPREEWSRTSMPVYFEDGRVFVVVPDPSMQGYPSAFMSVEISTSPKIGL